MDEPCKKEVLEWLEKVSMDENTAHVIFEAHAYPKKFDALCFHCQQAAEKALKAVIVSKKIEVEKTHDLRRLFSILSAFFSIPDNVQNAGKSLTMYSILPRYPHEWEIDERIAKKAMTDMDVVVTWVKSLLLGDKL